MKKIKLTKGYFALVDDESFDFLNQWKWKYHKNGYAVRTATGGKQIYMHRIINQTPSRMFTDHIDRNGLNNQKNNLRTITNSKNLMNTGLWKHNTSGTKGVTWHASRNKWQSQISVNKKNYYLGVFSSFEDAVLARKKAELIYHHI